MSRLAIVVEVPCDPTLNDPIEIAEFIIDDPNGEAEVIDAEWRDQ